MFFQTAAVALLAGAASAVPAFPAHRRGLITDVHNSLSTRASNSSNSTVPTGDYKQISYWGQVYEKPLADVCASKEGVDTVVLSFVNQYGNTTNGQAIANVNFNCLSNVTKDADVNDKWAYDGCQTIGKDIKKCHDLKKKVLLSIGGYVDYSDLKDGKEFADSLWNQFGGGSGNKPFGGESVDGFDFDIERGDSKTNKVYSDTIDALRAKPGFEGKYIITGAPQCPKSEDFMTTMIKDSKFDEIYMQFYNNPSCSTNDTEGLMASWDDWYGRVNAGASKGAKIFLGMPSAKPAAGDGWKGGPDPYYIEPKAMAELVNKAKSKKSFAGVMLWDAGNAMNNTVDGCNYHQQVRNVLDKGKAC